MLDAYAVRSGTPLASNAAKYGTPGTTVTIEAEEGDGEVIVRVLDRGVGVRPEEADRLFDALSVKGTINMPIQETFWAHRFGMLVDQFGTPWMVNCEKAAA